MMMGVGGDVMLVIRITITVTPASRGNNVTTTNKKSKASTKQKYNVYNQDQCYHNYIQRQNKCVDIHCVMDDSN